VQAKKSTFWFILPDPFAFFFFYPTFFFVVAYFDFATSYVLFFFSGFLPVALPTPSVSFILFTASLAKHTPRL
jgi:hypothetical protein